MDASAWPGRKAASYSAIWMGGRPEKRGSNGRSQIFWNMPPVRNGKSLQNLVVEFVGFNAAAHLKKAGEAFIMETVC